MTVISETTTKIASPLIVVSAAALLVQGHQLPGGGFIGGVMTVSSFALIYIIFDIEYVRQKFPLNGTEDVKSYYRKGFVSGLLIAFGTGLSAILFDLEFLTHTFTKIHHVPLYGELELASAFAFDLGVYFVVVGGLMTAVSVVGEE